MVAEVEKRTTLALALQINMLEFETRIRRDFSPLRCSRISRKKVCLQH